jgi:hypothetical protein
MFEAKMGARRQKFVMANVKKDFSCAACLPLIMMWSLDLLSSLFTNDQKFK